MMQYEDYMRKRHVKKRPYTSEERKNLKKLIFASLCFITVGMMCGVVVVTILYLCL